MWNEIINWTIIGPIFFALFGLGAAMVGIVSYEFTVARLLFTISASLFLIWIGFKMAFAKIPIS